VPVTIGRPTIDEYAPYCRGYVRRVPDGDVLKILEEQIMDLRAILDVVPEARADYRTGPGEWSIKEVMGHLSDCERVFAYRALCISRKDATTFPGFDQDDYVRESNFASRSLANLVQEFELLRRANVLAYQALTEADGRQLGRASDSVVSVRALLYIMAGHVFHHLDSLHAEYLPRINTV
jgi:DinB family protein